MRLIIAIAALVHATASAEAENPTSLCVKGETAIFSCAIRGRTASLCASADVGPERGTMTYRFGKPGAIELAYPELGTTPSKAFSRGSLSRGDYVKFVRNDVTYQIYSVIPQGLSPYGGIMVDAKGKKSVDLRCDHGDDGLGSDNWKLMYQAELPEDPSPSMDN